VLKYVGPDKNSEDSDLKKFVLLNHASRDHLAYQVWKQALLFETDVTYLNLKRITIWKLFLQIKREKKDYYAFRDKVLSTDENDRVFELEGTLYKAQALKP